MKEGQTKRKVGCNQIGCKLWMSCRLFEESQTGSQAGKRLFSNQEGTCDTCDPDEMHSTVPPRQEVSICRPVKLEGSLIKRTESDMEGQVEVG